MSKRIFLIIASAIFLFCLLVVYLFISNFNINASIKGISEQREKKLRRALSQERELIKKEMEEGTAYKETKAVFEQTFKELELEKKRFSELQKEGIAVEDKVK